MASVRNGPSDDTRAQRLVMFDRNVIDIEGKSTFTLFVEEVRF